jgi:6-pyruvoyltetrahydropterin/6-carboxytetrahydropterin synthase
MAYRSTKTFTHETGLSCCFRQWRAKSHCAYLHGYAISVKLEFAATHLDENGWVFDFGGLKAVRDRLHDYYDHKLLVAMDDPKLETIKDLEKVGVAQVVVLVNVGCEAFARHIGLGVQQWLDEHETNKDSRRVWLHSCEVREHGGNSAIWLRDQ